MVDDVLMSTVSSWKELESDKANGKNEQIREGHYHVGPTQALRASALGLGAFCMFHCQLPATILTVNDAQLQTGSGNNGDLNSCKMRKQQLCNLCLFCCVVVRSRKVLEVEGREMT